MWTCNKHIKCILKIYLIFALSIILILNTLLRNLTTSVGCGRLLWNNTYDISDTFLGVLNEQVRLLYLGFKYFHILNPTRDMRTTTYTNHCTNKFLKQSFFLKSFVFHSDLKTNNLVQYFVVKIHISLRSSANLHICAQCKPMRHILAHN